MLSFHQVTLALLCILPSFWLAEAASLPDSVVLILPVNTTLANQTNPAPSYGIQGGGSLGIYRSVYFALTFPNGTTLSMGGVIDTCPGSNGTTTLGFNNTQAGIYTLVANITYGIPTYSNCTGPFSYQSEFLTNSWTILPSNASPGLALASPVATVTETFASAPTGTLPSVGSRTGGTAGTIIVGATAMMAGLLMVAV